MSINKETMPKIYGMFKCVFYLFSIFEITSALKMAILTQVVVQVKVHLFDLPETCAVYFDSAAAQFFYCYFRSSSYTTVELSL